MAATERFAPTGAFMISARPTTVHTFVIVAAIALLGGVAARAPAQITPTLRRGTLVLVQDKARVTLNVEIADTPESREVGLMNRPSLPDDAGMLFVFESTSHWAFWMKNTLVPLSVGFIDEQWKIVDIQDMRVGPNPETGRLDIYEAAKPSRYALEVNQGLFARRGIGVGAKVIPAFKLK
jgi:uncharacterized membrane protein (UPF0127 family)